MIDFRNKLADYLSGQADWREQKAQEWPEDERNARAAESLRFASIYVDNLDPTDVRLRVLALCCDEEELPFMPGEDAARDITAAWFHDSEEEVGNWLDRLTVSTVDDTLGILKDELSKYLPSS